MSLISYCKNIYHMLVALVCGASCGFGFSSLALISILETRYVLVVYYTWWVHAYMFTTSCAYVFFFNRSTALSFILI